LKNVEAKAGSNVAGQILVVDDEADVLSLLRKGLAAEGYSVITADNGEDAVMLAESEHPDLIILDVLMPGIDGGEVARRLKETPETENIPVIFLTGMFPKREGEEGREVGGHILFDKPYDILKLISAMEELMQKQETTA
jgi:CheY-like chemotaxis protein